MHHCLSILGTGYIESYPLPVYGICLLSAIFFITDDSYTSLIKGLSNNYYLTLFV